MKVTVYCPETPCYGIDLVASGLIQLLGKENVRLVLSFTGGRDRTQFMQFKETYDWAARGSWNWKPEDSDLFICSYRLGQVPVEAENNREAPLVVIDDADGCHSNRIFGNRTLLIFRREVNQAHLDEFPFVRPLPFAAMPELVAPKSYRDRSIPVFFRAQSTGGSRREIAGIVKGLGGDSEIVEEGCLLSKVIYNQRLCNSMIGISDRGAGNDTYRYWEIPYCGAMLLSFRSPNVIPNNFIEDEEAVFFKDSREMDDKLRRLLQDPSEVERIAINGAKKVRSHHMAIHRAQYVLSEVEKELSLACS